MLAVAALLCLLPAVANSADRSSGQTVQPFGKTSPLAGQRESNVLSNHNEFHPGTPLVLDPVTGALEFDLGGSETRKLQLKLAYPLVLESNHHLALPLPGSRLFGTDATLRIPLGKGFSLQGGAEQILGTAQFRPLGSIQCMNGTLGPGSYTASGCRFVTDENPVFDRRTLNLGARQDIGNLSTSLNWFTSTNKQVGDDVYRPNRINLENQLLAPFASIGVVTDNFSTPYIANEISGIDLNFQLGFTTDQAGEIRLGLALTRVIDANYQSLYNGHDIGPLDWNIAKPFDAAALGLEWSRGSFSSGIRGYYREPINFLNRDNLDSVSTFDVHFTWRAPWNANLSVGASNVLGAGVDDRNSIDKTTDRYESIYGRIPYVRYQQDL